MKCVRLLPFALGCAALATLAAENAPTPAAPLTLDELEALPAKPLSDPEGWSLAQRRTQATIALIESGRLESGDDFLRASKHIFTIGNRYRSARVRYELLLAAAALGQAEAEKQLASAWDEMLASLGRPMRTDFRGAHEKYPEQYQFEPAPDCVQTVLRDPALARTTAQSAGRNAEMKEIVAADQADRRADWSKFTEEERKGIHDRDVVRNQRTREIIAAGELRTAADFANAALVMQHSARFSGYQTAHELAVCSMLLGDRSTGRWLIAATYDRMLGSVGHEQRFGTQYSGAPGQPATMQPVDSAGICDAQRVALGCPTLEQARQRTLGGARAEPETARLVKEFSGPNRTVRDPKFGLSAIHPEGWKLHHVIRWGDQQNTIAFEATADAEAQPSLYYRVYRQPRPMPREASIEFVREEAKKKETSRRENYNGYTNRADSFRAFTIGEYPAFSWLADFTSANGDKWAEYFVRLQTEQADASFFLQAPAERIDALRPAVDQLMATLKMPVPEGL